MENTNSNYEKLFEETVAHSKDKKYLTKIFIKSKNKYSDPTYHKKTLLSLAFNIALENYTKIRPNKQKKELKNITTASEMLLRFYNNKHYKNIESIHIENSLIDDEQNYNYISIENFKKVEYKLYGVIERLRNYHSHYVHEPGILTFEDFFNIDKNLSTQDFTDAKEWFKKRFDDAHNHLTNSLTKRQTLLEKKKELDEISEEEKLLLIVKLNQERKNNGSKSLIKELEKELSTKITKKEKEHIAEKEKEIYNTHKFFTNDIKFYTEINNRETNVLSLNAQLFIACMFLDKRQAKIILERWRDLKDATGYYTTKQTFFTYFCISESYSLNNYNNNLLKFREITSKLSNIPYSENEHLKHIYEEIDIRNKATYKKLDTHHATYSDNNEKTKLSKKLKDLNEKKQKLENTLNSNFTEENLNKLNNLIDEISELSPSDSIIPVRNRNVFTSIMVQYMIDNKLFGNNIKIAINKTPTDYLNYYTNNKDDIDIKKNLTFLKNQIKNLDKNSEKREKLKKHFKALKRNFIFKTPKEIEELIGLLDKNDESITHNNKTYTYAKDIRYAIKKKNLTIQYTHTDKISTITLSPQLLLKWVFIHLTTGVNKGLDNVETYIKERINLFNNQDNLKDVISNFNNNFNIKHIRNSKVFPKSIIVSTEVNKKANEAIMLAKSKNNKLPTFEDKVIDSVIHRKADIQHFLDENHKRKDKKPWKFASNRKIKSIFNFLQFSLLHYVYTNEEFKEKTKKEKENFIRHKSFNATTYDTAREYFRFYGRYKSSNIDDASVVNLTMVHQLLEDYEFIFSFIENEIKHSENLEDLFTSVSLRYLELIENIIENYTKIGIDNICKIFKITKPSNYKNTNTIFKEGFYNKSFALSPDVISLEFLASREWRNDIPAYRTFKNDLEEFKSKKQNKYYKKKYFVSEYSFIRNQLQKDGVFTNSDYILTEIIDIKNGGTKGKISSVGLRLLMQFKTEELIMWNIAKTYWKKDCGSDYNLKQFETKAKYKNYLSLTSFNKVYKQDLDYLLKIDKQFWIKQNGKPDNKERFKLQIEQENNPLKIDEEYTIKVKVPAKRYDNKFLNVETELIKEFCLWKWSEFTVKDNEIILPTKFNFYNENNESTTSFNLQNYDDLMKVINKELKLSTKYIGEILRAEKKLIDRGIKTANGDKTNFIQSELEKKYRTEKGIDHFFISFQNEKLIELFMDNIPENETENFKNNIESYLGFFRNFAMHYQLQDPKRKQSVKRLLNKINGSLENAISSEYTEGEY